MEKIILETKERFYVPGISVSVLKDKEKMHYGFGLSDCEADVEAAPDTVYCIGSSTKAFTATALCILAAEGRLDIDMPVKKYLTEFRMYDEYSTEQLTIRDALSHRSGLPRHDTSWLNTPERTTAEQVAALAYISFMRSVIFGSSLSKSYVYGGNPNCGEGVRNVLGRLRERADSSSIADEFHIYLWG